MKESLLLSESEKVRQNTLEANKECYSERSLTDQSEKKSINSTPNSLSKIKEIRIGNARKVIIDNLNINSVKSLSLFLMDGFSKPYKLDRKKRYKVKY